MEHQLTRTVMTHMVPEVVGTMGMSSASVGMDQGIWNCGANSRITMFLQTRFSSRSNEHGNQIRCSGARSKKIK